MSESSREPAKDRMILPVTPQADTRARRFEHDVRRERNREYAVIIDNESGRVVGSRIRGERAIIQFTDEQLRSMYGRILSHNHPDGWRYPETDPRRQGAGFSDYDARMLADWGLAEIRAVTPAYLYRLRPPADPASHYFHSVLGASSWAIKDAVDRAFDMADQHLVSLVATGAIAPEAYDVLINHEAMLRLAQDWGVLYEREVLP
ncbi:MAG: hypothetical protein H0V37_10195 [Chloroflexia bacterium]|nr:hypothetical protein [Chloroflexia bacterium]